MLRQFRELFSDLPPLACTSLRGRSPSWAGFGPEFLQRRDHPINPHHRFLAGEVLTDVGGCPVIPGGAIGEQGYQCGQGGGLFLGCGGDHGSRKEAGIDGFQDVMELLRIRAGDHGELANGGELEVEGDQALAGGGRGVFKDDLDRFKGCPAGAAEVITTGQGAQPDQGGRGHCVARGGRVVEQVLCPRDQGLVALAGVEEAPLVRVGELVDHHPGQVEGTVDPARLARGLVQSGQAVDQVGVIVEVGIELGLTVLVRVQQPGALARIRSRMKPAARAAASR